MIIRFTILGQLYSMKNSKTISWRGMRPRVIKHQKAQQFEEDFMFQIPNDVRKHITEPVRVDIRAFYPSARQDLDVSLIFDLLQKAGVIENDRQVHEQHCWRFIDRERPRVEIEVSPLTNCGCLL